MKGKTKYLYDIMSKETIMGTIKDAYDIIKDLLNEAKKLKNFDFVEMVMDIQQKFFDLNNENQKLKTANQEKDLIITQLSIIKDQVDSLKMENSKLKSKITLIEKLDDLSFLENEIETQYKEIVYFYTSNSPDPIENTLKESIKDIYYFVAPKLLTPSEDSKFLELFNKSVNGTYSSLDSKIVGKLKAKFMEYKLIEIKETPKQPTKIQLSEFGREVLNKINEL
jgi:hypothetical protein